MDLKLPLVSLPERDQLIQDHETEPRVTRVLVFVVSECNLANCHRCLSLVAPWPRVPKTRGFFCHV